MSPLTQKRKKEAGKPRKVVTNPLKTFISNTRIQKRSRINPSAILLAVVLVLLFIGIPLYTYTSIEKLKAISIEDTLELENREISSPDGLQTFLLMVDDAQKGEYSTSHAYCLIWNTEKNSGVLVMLPGWLYVVPKANSPETYVAVDDLGYLVNEIVPDEPEAVIEEYENVIGINIDDYFWIDSEARETLEASVGVIQNVDSSAKFLKNFNKKVNLRSLILSVDKIDELALGLHTDLNSVELYRRIKLISTLEGTESLPVIDLSEEWGSIDGSLSSGTQISIMNYSAFDENLSQYYEILRSREIEKEQVKIEVFNAGEISGLASRIMRRLANNGLKVVRAGNCPVDYDKNTIYISDMEKFKGSLEATIGILGYGENVEIVPGRPDFLTTGDIIVIGVE